MMAEFDPNRFIVLNRKFLKNLDSREHQTLMTLLRKANSGDQRYLVCNQDEPYAYKVKQMIIDGETAKEKRLGLEYEMDEELTFNVYLYRNVFFRVDGIKARSFAEAVARAQKTFDIGHGFDDFLRPGGCVGNVQEAEEGLGVLVDQLNEEGDVEDSVWVPDWMSDELAHGGQVEEEDDV